MTYTDVIKEHDSKGSVSVDDLRDIIKHTKDPHVVEAVARRVRDAIASGWYADTSDLKFLFYRCKAKKWAMENVGKISNYQLLKVLAKVDKDTATDVDYCLRETTPAEIIRHATAMKWESPAHVDSLAYYYSLTHN